MDGNLLPAAIAAGGGGAMAGAIYLHERRREEVMRASRVRVAARFAFGLKHQDNQAALGGLAGLPPTDELIWEIAGAHERIGHRVWVPSESRRAVESTLTASLSAVRFADAPEPGGASTMSLRIFVASPSVLRTDIPEQASRSLLSAFTGLERDERLVLRWALRADRPRMHGNASERRQDARARQAQREWQAKTARPGFRIAGLVLVRASSSSRARHLLDRVAHVLRSRATNPRDLRLTYERGSRSMAACPRTTHSSGWASDEELSPLLGWPVGDEVLPGLEVGVSRTLLVPSNVARDGRRLFIGRNSEGERAVAISAKAALRHQLLVGGTGTGKSTTLARIVLDDLARGHGGLLIDPKDGSLVNAILERVPSEHADRVVVLDPASKGPVPGIDLFGGGDVNLAADVVTGALASIFRDAWGPRTDHYLRLALRTLSEVPGATLVDVGRLFFEPGFRRQAIAHLSDRIAVGAWQTYSSMSTAEQAQHVQAPMGRVMNLVARPAVRAIIAQREPKLDIGRLLEERKLLLVSLSPGTLGEPAARLLGALIMYLTWSAIEARAALPPERRHPVFVYLDELGSIADLPFSFETLAERARGLGAGVVVALQTFGRLPESLRGSLLGNAQSLVTFRASSDEAARLAKELPGLSARDLQSLGAYEVAARVATSDGGVAVVTGYTEPLEPPTKQADRIRRLSTERYGVDPKETERWLTARLSTREPEIDPTQLGRTRRRP